MNEGDYVTIILISFAAFFPVVYGSAFALFYSDGQKGLRHFFVISQDKGGYKVVLVKIIYLFILSFISILAIVRIADPVTTEGWFRTLFIIILLSAESVFVYCFIGLTNSIKERVIHFLILILFLAAVPLGLVCHHPWNYFLFYSPLYWLSWSWIIPPVIESITYAAISIILSVLYLLAADWWSEKKIFK